MTPKETLAQKITVARLRNGLENLYALADLDAHPHSHTVNGSDVKRIASQALNAPVHQVEAQVKALLAYADACDDVVDALLVFVTERVTPMESAHGYIQAPVQQALQNADKVRAVLYKAQGRDPNIHDRLESLRSKRKALKGPGL